MEDDTAPAPTDESALARAHLNDLLAELLERVEEVMDTQDRLRGLLDAVVAIAGDLSLNSVLQRIISVACQLAGARYGALGVLGSGADRRLREFVTHGFTPEQRELVGQLPRGHGILGLIIDQPAPLRLTDLGAHELSYGFPPDHPPMSTFLGVPIRSRGSVFGNLYLTEKVNASSFTAEDEQIVVALAAAAGVAIENARLYELIGLQNRWLEAAADVTSALLGEGGLADALNEVTVHARDNAAADVASVLLRDATGWLTAAVSGRPAAGGVGIRIPDDDPLLHELLRTEQIVVAVDAAAPNRTACLIPSPAGWPGAGSLVLFPLRSAGGVTGILAIGWSAARQDDFRGSDLRLVADFAAQIALALQLARARENEARLAVLEDRDRIGRDLHDLVIQRLFAIGLTLDNTGRLIADPVAKERVAVAVDDVDATIKDLRRSIFELSAPAVSTDLRARLAENVALVVPALGFRPHVTTEGPVDSVVSDRVRPQLMAVLREALSNVVRHAGAAAVEVSLSCGEEVVLTVSDDGVGIADGVRHSGLRNMLERAQALGGTCDVSRRPSGGTLLIWSVPTRHDVALAPQQVDLPV